MTQKNDEEHTGEAHPRTGEAAQPERAFGSFEGSKKGRAPKGISGPLVFTEEQIAQLHGMFASGGTFRAVCTVCADGPRRYREQAQTFIRDAAPA
ncbi:hypothetical protein [Arthrobacter sp. 31Y]|uniref:hypothetical protein n=1 Tax=Arthrobacter sp. 31Y TaxID=1115632 RepID=UPI00046598C6|nr:hypothetical protein [Arthrobacter sp. 31Y]